MARPSVLIRERKPKAEDAEDIARTLWELAKETNEAFNRSVRDAKTKTADYTLDSVKDRIILVDASAGDVIITLPDAAEADHVEYTIVVTGIDVGVTDVTVTTGGGNINGSATIVLAALFDTLTAASDSTNYFRTDL